MWETYAMRLVPAAQLCRLTRCVKAFRGISSRFCSCLTVAAPVFHGALTHLKQGGLWQLSGTRRKMAKVTEIETLAGSGIKRNKNT